MKKFRILTSMFLVMAMIFTIGFSAFADVDPETQYKITIQKPTSSTFEDTKEHKYEGYQIFKGKVSEKDGVKVLNEIDWGANVNGTALLTAFHEKASELTSEMNDTDKAKAATEIAAADSPEAVARLLEKYKDNKHFAETFADIAYSAKTGTPVTSGDAHTLPLEFGIDKTKAGYYLFKDEDNSLEPTDPAVNDGAYTDFILQVVGDVTVEAKSDYPTLDKNIDAEGGVKFNTASVGDVIPYKITSKVPNMDGYEKYYFYFTDTLCDGLTFNNDNTFKVSVGEKTLQADTDPKDYELTADAHGFKLVFNNFKQYTAGDDIIVEYTATLNENADLTSTGNPNTVKLTYSNNPNIVPTGENEPGPDDEDVTGTTPPVRTVTYTTEIKLIKVDGYDDTRLAGAEFELKGNGVNTVLICTESFSLDNDKGTYYKLTDGTYTTVAPTEATADQYDSASDKYSRTTTMAEKKTKDENNAITATTNDKGEIVFAGLNAGQYTLKETTPPTGYNGLADPISFTLTADPSLDGCTWTIADNEDFVKDGVFTVTVENNKGIILPGTGGIGTVIFYVIGIMMIAAAIVMVVLKIRKNRVTDK